MTRGIAESVKVVSRSKRSGRVEAVITTNGYSKTRHGFVASFDGKPAIKVMEPGVGEVVLVITPSR